jgi:alcohol dehydrogenase YqhD (iron-dependent ADH family)
MNKERRETIARLSKRFYELQDELEDIRFEIENVKDEEQEYFDNMPENLQVSDRGVSAESAVDALEQAHDALYDLLNSDVVGLLETAQA